MVIADRLFLRSTCGSFQIHFSSKPLNNHEIWTVDAETSLKEDYGLKSENFDNL